MNEIFNRSWHKHSNNIVSQLNELCNNAYKNPSAWEERGNNEQNLFSLILHESIKIFLPFLVSDYKVEKQFKNISNGFRSSFRFSGVDGNQEWRVRHGANDFLSSFPRLCAYPLGRISQTIWRFMALMFKKISFCFTNGCPLLNIPL